MECPNCKEDAPRLKISRDCLGCDSCCPTQSGRDATMHRIVLNKFGNRMTHADAMRIKTNKKRSDGTYKPDPRWR